MSLESLNDTQTSSLNTALEQMKRKREVISQLDTRIAELITTPEELDEAILERRISRYATRENTPC